MAGGMDGLMADARIGRKAHVSSGNIGRLVWRRPPNVINTVHVADSDRSDDGKPDILDETLRVHEDFGVMSPRRRRMAWVAFVSLIVYGPVVAYLVRGPLAQYTIPHDTWLLSATVAGLVGYVLIVDDIESRKAARRAQSESGPSGTQAESQAEPPAPAEEG
jgi:hypothetical protein